MTTVQIDIEKLQSALTKLTNLANSIDNRRSAALRGSPISLPPLDLTGLGTKASWLRDQAPELQTRLDLAKLLDIDGDGQASYRVQHGDQLSEVEQLLSRELTEQLEDLDINDPEDRERAELLAQTLFDYRNHPRIAGQVMTGLGPDGLTSVLNKLGGLTHDPSGSNYTSLFPEEHDAAIALQDLMARGLSGMFATASPRMNAEWGETIGQDPWAATVLLRYLDRADREVAAPVFAALGNELREQENGDPTYWVNQFQHQPPFFGGQDFHDFQHYNPMREYLNVADNSTRNAQAVMGDADLRQYFLADRGTPDGLGDQTGTVLRIATVDAARHDNDQIARQAADISSNVLWLLGSDRDPIDGIEEEVGGIIATYVADADRVFDTNGDNGPGVNLQYLNGDFGGLPITGQDGFPRYGINLDQAHLRDVMEDIGDNDRAVEVVGRAVTAYNQLRINRDAEAHYAGPGDPPAWQPDTGGDPIVAASSASSQFAGFMVDGFVNGDIDSEEEAAAARRRAARFFTAPLDLIPTNRAPVIGNLIVGEVRDGVINGYADAGQVQQAIDEANATDETTRHLTRLQALYALQAHAPAGHTDTGAIPWPRDSHGRPVTPGSLSDTQIQDILEATGGTTGTTTAVDDTIESHHGDYKKDYGDN